jgi:hypothetical protein
VFCRECGKQIEDDARFCRFCGKPQADDTPGTAAASANAPRTGTGLQHRIRQVFPRHHLQDEFMHLATIAAFVLAVAGLLIGIFPALFTIGASLLFFSIALLLFLILRESTLSHIRVSSPRTGEGTRYHAARAGAGSPPGARTEAATTESSPPRRQP